MTYAAPALFAVFCAALFYVKHRLFNRWENR